MTTPSRRCARARGRRGRGLPRAARRVLDAARFGLDSAVLAKRRGKGMFAMKKRGAAVAGQCRRRGDDDAAHSATVISGLRSGGCRNRPLRRSFGAPPDFFGGRRFCRWVPRRQEVDAWVRASGDDGGPSAGGGGAAAMMKGTRPEPLDDAAGSAPGYQDSQSGCSTSLFLQLAKLCYINALSNCALQGATDVSRQGTRGRRVGVA